MTAFFSLRIVSTASLRCTKIFKMPPIQFATCPIKPCSQVRAVVSAYIVAAPIFFKRPRGMGDSDLQVPSKINDVFEQLRLHTLIPALHPSRVWCPQAAFVRSATGGKYWRWNDTCIDTRFIFLPHHRKLARFWLLPEYMLSNCGCLFSPPPMRKITRQEICAGKSNIRSHRSPPHPLATEGELTCRA